MKLRGLRPAQEQALVANLPHDALPEPDMVLVTTLRYDPRLPEITRHIPIALGESFDQKFFLSHLHYQRLKYGAKLLQWPVKINYDDVCATLEKLLESLESEGTSDTPLKVRLTLSRSGQLDVTTSPAKPLRNLFSGLVTQGHNQTQQSPNLSDVPMEVVIDSVPLPPDFAPSPTASLKTNLRQVYTDARDRNHASPDREVLLVSSTGMITEGSICSMAAFRDGTWVTPPLDAGAMVSTVRSFLLELGYVKEANIPQDSLHDGEKVLLFNGVMGVAPGVVRRA